MIQIYKEHPVLPEEETPKEVIAEVDKIEQIDPVVSDSVQDEADAEKKAEKPKRGKNQKKETIESEIKGNDSSDEN